MAEAYTYIAGVKLSQVMKQLEHDAIEAQLKFLQGKVLTVVEAAVSADVQRDALKVIIRQQFREQLDHIYQLIHGEPQISKGSSTGKSIVSILSDVSRVYSAEDARKKQEEGFDVEEGDVMSIDDTEWNEALKVVGERAGIPDEKLEEMFPSDY